MTVTDFEVIDHGINGRQYFPGCGVAFSKFEYVATGCGDNFADAIEDALESMWQGEAFSGTDFTELKRRIAAEGYGTIVHTSISSTDGKVMWRDSRSVEASIEDENETYYYVSIRYNVGE